MNRGPSLHHEPPRLFELFIFLSEPCNLFLHFYVVSRGELSPQLIQTHPQRIAD